MNWQTWQTGQAEEPIFDPDTHDPNVVTETDVSDPERDVMSRWNVCDECGTVIQGIDDFFDTICMPCTHVLQGVL